MDVDVDVKSTTSDSDSDYLPENSVTKSRPRKQSKVIGIKKPKYEAHSNQRAPPTILLLALPLELLVTIFQYIVQHYGPFLALKKYGLVSKRWRLAFLDNTLWQSVVLSGRESWLNIKQALKWLCIFKHGTVKKLSVLSWRTWHTNEQLLQLCHNLKCAEFSNCSLKFDAVFMCLEQVERLTITECHIKNFDALLCTNKGTLRYLSLFRVSCSLCCSLSKFDTPLTKLNTLQLDNFWNFKADSVSVLQKMCPNLIYLRLCLSSNGFPRSLYSEVCPNEFLSLKYLELCFPTFSNNVLESNSLHSLLAASPNLQSLLLIDYTQPCTVNYDILVPLVPSNLRELDLIDCKLDFSELLNKLLLRCLALQRLTIASPKGQRVGDDIITTIVASPCANTLRYLDLSGTDVTINGIKLLLNSVCNLKHLDVMRCRYLPRGTRRLYNNATDLDKLSKIVL